MTVLLSTELAYLLRGNRIIKWTEELIRADKFGFLERPQLICPIPSNVRTEAEIFFRCELKQYCLEDWERLIKIYYPRPYQNKQGFQPSCLRFIAARKIKEQIFVAARIQFIISLFYCRHVDAKLGRMMKDFALSYMCYDREGRICKMNVHQVSDWVLRSYRKGDLNISTFES
jgi:hypothetical protein